MKKVLILYLLLVAITNFGFAQTILTFEFSSLAGNETTASSNSNDANLTSSTISRGAGLSAATNSGRFNAQSWVTTNSVTDAVSGNDYFQFTITPNSGFSFSITSIVANFERSGTGPKAFSIRSSVDSYGSDLASATLNDVTSTQTRTFTFSMNNQTSAVTFRIYGYNAEETGGSGGLEGTGNDLVVNGSTASVSACIAPSTQASVFSSNTITSSSMNIAFTRGNGDGGVLVVAKSGSAVNTDPQDGVSYTANSVFASGDQLGTGNYVVYKGTANGTGATTGNINISGLSPLTTYHFAVYEYNTASTCYHLAELTGNATTICATPTDITGLTVSSGNSSQLAVSWTAPTCFDEILVVASTASITGTPTSADGSHYTANAAYGSGTASQNFNAPEFPVYKSTSNNVTVTNLTNGTNYFFKVFTRKGTTWSAGVQASGTPNVGSFFREDFDDNTGVATTVYVNGVCNDGDTDYFGKVCLNGLGCGNTVGSAISLTGGDGGTFLGAHDTNAEASCNSSASVSATFDNINVSGVSVIYLCFEVAEDDASDGLEDWDANSAVSFEVDFDNSGSFSKVIQISGGGSTNTEPGIDTDCNGTENGTKITSTFNTYCFGISGTGSVMDLRVQINNLDDGDEDIAIDNVRLYNGSTSLPVTPTSATCAKSLPVDLVSFDVTNKEHQAVLFWQTASEINNSHFEIERSSNAKDFFTIGSKEGQGTTNISTFYTFVDETPYNGMNYYRLKQMDNDGRFEYSKIVALEMKSLAAQEIRIFPNPIKDQFSIDFSGIVEPQALVSIYTINGQLIYHTTLNNLNGVTNIDSSNLPKGIYTIHVMTSKGLVTERIIKQ
jgi:hypothetical protein